MDMIHADFIEVALAGVSCYEAGSPFLHTMTFSISPIAFDATRWLSRGHKYCESNKPLYGIASLRILP